MSARARRLSRKSIRVAVVSISLLACAGFSALWIRSYFVRERLSKSWYGPTTAADGLIHATHPRGFVGVWSFDGQVCLWSGTDGPPEPDPVGLSAMAVWGDDEWPARTRGQAERLEYERGRPTGSIEFVGGRPKRYKPDIVSGKVVFDRLGFLWAGGRWATYPRHWFCFDLWVPFWFLTLVTVQPPLWWLIRRVAPRRRRDGLFCPRCGYDLRGNPASGRCPECGTPVTAPAAAVSPPKGQINVTRTNGIDLSRNPAS